MTFLLKEEIVKRFIRALTSFSKLPDERVCIWSNKDIIALNKRKLIKLIHTFAIFIAGFYC